MTKEYRKNGRICKAINGGEVKLGMKKRKRELFGETLLSWMSELAKNPCGAKQGDYKDFRSVALSVREARLLKTHTTLSIHRKTQKKHKMHPSMYEDDTISNQYSTQQLRCSERLLSLANTPCQCYKSSAVDKCELKNLPISHPDNGSHKQELVNTDVSDNMKRTVVPRVVDAPVETHVLVGPQFQAEVPLWNGITCESDSKWLGTQIWTPDLEDENSCSEINHLGKGRQQESCTCCLPGSVECHRFHIAENRIKLRRELGLAFFHWKFDRMGEEVCLSWSAKEETRFEEVMRLHKTYLRKPFLPSKKTTRELVSYYFNVYIIKRRSYQNRVTPNNIDSDDEESECGSVGEAFGYNAVKVRGSEPLKCLLNEQVINFD